MERAIEGAGSGLQEEVGSFLRPLHLLLSGSRATLLPPRPLRTGHARYRASGSSPCRLLSSMVGLVAPSVDQAQVGLRIRSAAPSGLMVVLVHILHLVVRIEPHLALGAGVSLLLEQPETFLGDHEGLETGFLPLVPVVPQGRVHRCLVLSRAAQS